MNPADLPTTSTMPAIPPPEVVKPKRSRLWLVASIATVTLGVAIGVVLWFFMKQPINESSATPGVMQLPALKASSDAAPALSFVRSLAKLTGVNSSINETYDVGRKTFDIYRFQVSVSNEQASRIIFAPTSDEGLAQVDEIIKAYFKANGFTEKKEGEIFLSAYYYFNENYVCDYMTMQATPARQRTATDTTPYLSLVCAKTADYKKNAETLSPFYEQIIKSKKYQIAIIRMEIPDFKDSKTNGYKTFQAATVTTQSELTKPLPDDATRVARFYQNPDKKWHMIENFDAKLSCSDVDANTDIKKAYRGDVCLTNYGNKQTIEK